MPIFCLNIKPTKNIKHKHTYNTDTDIWVHKDNTDTDIHQYTYTDRYMGDINHTTNAAAAQQQQQFSFFFLPFKILYFEEKNFLKKKTYIPKKTK